MKKYLLIPFLMIQFIYANHQSLQFEKIPNIMDKFFQYHVEAKGFSPTVVRRSFKLYIENFDPDKVYLLQEEVLPFLHLSDRRAQNSLLQNLI